MTPGDIATFARQMYNAVNDDFFSDTELYRHIWMAQKMLAQVGDVIERVYQTSTVADQQEYAWPTYAIKIKRITYGGNKLQPITFREDDSLTLSNSTTTASGTPQYYALWSRTFYLRPVPAEIGTLKIFSYNHPQEVTATSTLEVPEIFHLDIANYVAWQMASKDKNWDAASNLEKRWNDPRDGALKRARDYQRLSRRGDGFTAVQDIETLPVTVIGAL